MNQNTKENPLDIRIRKFITNLIQIIRKIPENHLSKSIISQLIRSGTSIGANFQEAQECESRNDFIHKLSICKKESRETSYWLNILEEIIPEKRNMLKTLELETTEFTRIFAASIATAKRNSKL